MSKQLRIGMVGYGFMGRTHSNAYRKAPNFFDLEHKPVLKAVCGRSEDKAKAFAEQWGYESVETDYRKLVQRDDIDAVDITAPNNAHKDIALAAAEAGKMILCEKPLAMDTAEAEQMAEAVEKAGVANTVWYNYRRVPAVTLARKLIDDGRLGRIFHVRSNFLQDFTISEDLPQGGHGLWRLDANVAGSGVTGDLLAHNVDTAMWLNGALSKISAQTETFVKERVHQETGKKEPVKIDDAAMFMGRFENGALATFEATRYARGHKALFTFEINGEHASVWWDLQDMCRLHVFDHNDDGDVRGWHNIHVTDGDHPYMGNWWVPGLQIGYEHTFIHQAADFLKSLETGEPIRPNFRDAVEVQKVCDTILDSAKTGAWTDTGVRWPNQPSAAQQAQATR